MERSVAWYEETPASSPFAPFHARTQPDGRPYKQEDDHVGASISDYQPPGL